MNNNHITYSQEFHRAFEKLIGLEGRYSFDPNDPGGETVFGVSRRSHPDWEGWAEVDALKKLEIQRDEWDLEPVRRAAKKLYFEQYWRPVYGENLGADHFPLIFECFESCVNVGVKQLSAWVQVAANCFVEEGSDIQVDGVWGPKTLGLVVKLLEDRQRTQALRIALNCLQGRHYIELATRAPNLRRYLVGWLTQRVQL